MSLIHITHRLLPVDTFAYGGDDTGKGAGGLLGVVVNWEIKAKHDCFKANFAFFIKKIFKFLDAVGIGKCFYPRGFKAELIRRQYYETGPERNFAARKQIIDALGGEEACISIPRVDLNPQDQQTHMALGEEYFLSGQWIVQGEDLPGRKFVVIRVTDIAGRLIILTLYQRYRETSIQQSGEDGSTWILDYRPIYNRIIDYRDRMCFSPVIEPRPGLNIDQQNAPIALPLQLTENNAECIALLVGQLKRGEHRQLFKAIKP